MKGYPRKFYGVLIATFTALLLSGSVLIPTTLTMRLEWDVFWRLGADARIAVAALHVACGYAALTLLGSVWTLHMRAGWRQRRNHRNGILLAMLWLILAATGLGVFYLADETAVQIAALGHVAAGLLTSGAFVCHMVLGRRLRRHLHRHATAVC